jgi:hypothetical protein
VSAMIPPELVALARQVYAEDVSVRFGPRAVAWWGLVFDCVLSDDEQARATGVRLLVKGWEEQEQEIARLTAEVDRPRRRFWQRRKGERCS